MEIEVALVEAEVPLLILNKQLKILDAKIDFGNSLLEFNNSDEKIKLNKAESNHYVLPVVNQAKVIAFIM